MERRGEKKQGNGKDIGRDNPHQRVNSAWLFIRFL